MKVILILLSMLISIASVRCLFCLPHQDCWKSKLKATVPLNEYLSEISTYEMFESLIIRIWTSTVEFTRSALLDHTVEMVALCVIMIIAIVAYKTATKGRPNSDTNSRQDLWKKGTEPITSGPTTNVNLFNSLHCKNERLLTAGSAEIKSQYVIAPIEKPRAFKMGMDIISWLIQLEIYLENLDKSQWTRITVSLMENECMKKMNNIDKYLHTNSFDELKQELLNIYARKQIQTSLPIIDMKRNQSSGETIEGYGEELKSFKRKEFV
jgi:hypothetical protein